MSVEDDETNDDVAQAAAIIQQGLNKALAAHIGAPMDPAAVKKSVNDFLGKLGPGVEAEVSEVVGDMIRMKLKQPSFASQIIAKLEGPYWPWFEDGLVHVMGRVGDSNVLVCTFADVAVGGYSEPGLVISCLRCLVSKEAINL